MRNGMCKMKGGEKMKVLKEQKQRCTRGTNKIKKKR